MITLVQWPVTWNLSGLMDNLEVVLALFNLGRVYGKSAEYDKALACFNECARIRTAQLGKSHDNVLAVYRYIDAVERKRRGR